MIQIQSGFVLALILAVVFFVDHVGGTDELARRVFQVALAATIAFTVAAGTTAFVRADEGSSDSIAVDFGGGDVSDEDVVNRAVASRMVEFGLGVVALLSGLSTMRQLRTVPTGFVIGGLLLILFGGVSDTPTEYSILDANTGGSREIDALNFVLLLGGLVALMWYGFTRLEEREDGEDEDDEGLTQTESGSEVQ